MKEFLAVLKSCGYDAYFVKDKAEALSLAKSYIKPNMSVGLGGSESVKEIGLLDFLLENKEINISFVITDLKTAGSSNPLSTGDFIQGINKLRESKKLFKFYWRAETGNLERFFDNLVFTECSFNQDASYGYSAGKYAYKGNFTMKQIQFADRAKISLQMVPALKGTTSPPKSTNVSTKYTGFPKDSPLLVKPPPVPTQSTDPNLDMLKSEISRNKRGGS
jgi:hypothetical protein